MEFVTINRDLIPLKALLFSFYGGLGCLWPFLTLHMKQLGLSLEETAIINMVLPFVVATSRPVAGIIADRTGQYKPLLLVVMVTSSIVFTTLLLVPPSIPATAPVDQSYQFHLYCSSFGSVLGAEVCPVFGSCSAPITFSVSNCHHVCWGNISGASQRQPHVCFRSDEGSNCLVYNPNSASPFFRLRSLVSDAYSSSSATNVSCSVPLTEPSREDGQSINAVFCRTPSPVCQVECEVAIESRNLPCSTSTTATFWIYLGIRCLAEMLYSVCFPLLDAINLTLSQQYGGHFGQQQLFGIFALGLFGPISGKLIDLMSSAQGYEDYSPCFYTFDILMVCSCIITVFIPMDIKTQTRKVFRGVIRMLRNLALATLFIAVFMLGVIWGFLETFLYWYLLDLGASRLLIGMTQLTSVIPAIPLLYKSEWVLKKVGYVNLLIIAFLVYSIRCTGYAYLTNPMWCLAWELTRIFSIYLARLSFTTYAALLAPPELTVTMQSLVFLLHFDIGRGTGSLVGGFLMDSFGAQTTFQITAVFAGLLGCLYFAVHHFYLKSRTPKPKAPSLVAKERENVNKTLQNGHLPSSTQEPLLITGDSPEDFPIA